MILVDHLITVTPAMIHGRWPFASACHMMSDQVGPDGLAELQVFARRIGLADSWLQTPDAGPHYDLTAGKRAMAIRLGALPVDMREFTERCVRPWRAYCREQRAAREVVG